MGIDCRLVDERGEPEERLFKLVSSCEMAFPYSGVQENPLNFKLIQYINPYGDTIFNKCQMVDLLIDIERLSLAATTEGKKEKLEQVKLMAEYCLKHNHYYLKFIGD